MSNLPLQTPITANGTVYYPGLNIGQAYSLSLKGIYDGASVAVALNNGPSGAYADLDDSPLNSSFTEIEFVANSGTLRFVTTGAGASTNLQPTLTEIF